MTARLTKPVTPDLRPGGGEAGKATRRPVGPDALAALLRAAHATTRADALLHLFDAICHGLPAADAKQAIAEWGAANVPQRIETT